jgi:hypothetical protein
MLATTGATPSFFQLVGRIMISRDDRQDSGLRLRLQPANGLGDIAYRNFVPEK